ncbi:enoyl-CoA hydratase [Comamonas serinivorans]|uniref:Enoyl-CoA hydratase n=1 Tax=Comamonas serinivorans TaxID=1082851 RepID=A0A1Y0EMS4_9BURK|nr:enoyl-CoA hydratase-related protein [Comamonas serinivorans]ARU04619.1 enoyl-CoA hydratase [Comamonas serinivorans]
MAPAIHWQREGQVARVVIRNPARFNAMTRSMWRELRRVFDDLQALIHGAHGESEPGADLRVVVVQGASGHFCAGGDISEYPAFRFDEARLRGFHEDEVWGGLAAMLACDLPIVAAIAGNCMGAGVEIASCCDLRIASQAARFGAPIAKLGFPMAPRELQLVGSRLGDTVARAMLLEAALYDAPALLQAGFLTRLCAPDQVQAEADACAARVASLAPQAARLHKQSLRALGQGTPVDVVVQTAYAYADSAEHREGVQAFLAKRPPVF